VSGSARVVDAIASGKRAALGIHRHVSGESPEEAGDPVQAVQFGDLNLLYFVPARRTPTPHIPPAARARSMAEVNGGWEIPEAVGEAARCGASTAAPARAVITVWSSARMWPSAGTRSHTPMTSWISTARAAAFARGNARATSSP
jgi:hypothetical protein